MTEINYKKIFQRPDSEGEVTDLVEKILRKHDVADILPTPIDDLIESVNIDTVTNFDEIDESFFDRLKGKAKQKLKATIQKIRGIADLRERVIYIPNGNNSEARERFIKGHELGHQLMPWQSVDPTYIDSDRTLSQKIQDQFEQEANFFSSEVLFQGYRFRSIALDYQASVDAIRKISDMHVASFQATLWRYVEVQDEIIAVAQYYPVNAFDEEGNKVLQLWKIIPSAKFSKKYGDIKLPERIRTGHPWVYARDLLQTVDGIDRYECGDSKVEFQWQAYWNRYTLFVLIRRKPRISSNAKIIKPNFW